MTARTAAGDERRFAADLAEHRRELHVHCYRMLASYDDAEDAVQETFLRAWRSRSTFDGTAVRPWLYRIATNACLDLIRRRGRQPREVRSAAEVSWLQPYPDGLLDEVSAVDDPGEVVITRETVALTFLVALQTLPPRQRAALLLRDVSAMSAAETALLLGTSVAAANSALQRARATLQRHLPAQRGEWTVPHPTPEEQRLLERFIDAHERGDAAASAAIAATDIRVTMPPYPWCYEGRDAIAPLLERAFGPGREGDWRLLPTAVNRQPAAGSYLRRHGDTTFRAFKLDVLRVSGSAIAEITTFGPGQFALLGLPATLS